LSSCTSTIATCKHTPRIKHNAQSTHSKHTHTRSICRRMYDENDDPSDVEEMANIRGFSVEEKLTSEIYTSNFVQVMDGTG
uniref:Uncharacterized protein n=1 Tax=Periophthalmus magnuspinnatus TaxID=409849 RepID=A0A3B4ABK6_9GOBI